MDIRRIKNDNQSYYETSHTYEKTYALNPENSIRFENKFFIHNDMNKAFGFVEVSLINSMRYKAIISGFQSIDNKDARIVDIMKIEDEQEIQKRSTFKFILKYELNKDLTNIKDYGKVQFNWRSEREDIDGGILAYSVACNLEKRVDDVVVERADTKILQKCELTEIEIAFVNP